MSSDPVIALLKQLVAIDSVNPSLVPGAAGEAEVAEAVATYMRRQGFDVTMQAAAPGRPNVIGVVEGRQPGRSLMFCGHLDTVGVEGMAAPFDPVEREGRIYGRGSQDMKSGIAAMIDAARLVKDRGFPRGRLVVACVVDEEFMSLGADALVREWTADAAVVTEPTDLQVGVGHKGFAWFEIETRGRAAHGSRPADGRDAILRMGRVLQGLAALDAELQARTPHPVLGVPSLHASAIEGGGEWSVYPDRCRLRVERRTVAGETVRDAASQLEGILEALRADDPEFEASASTAFARPPYQAAPGEPVVAALRAALEATRLRPVETGMTFWTDAAILAEAGIPSVVFGPGGAGLHSADEHVRVREVVTCRDALAALAGDWGTG
jgi:acetylornithine deacetylase